MEKINLLYDATIVCNIMAKNSSRSGIFFVAYNVLLEFLKRPQYNVYLYADDLVDWLWAILSRGASGRVYNVGSDEAVSIRDLARQVCDSLGAKGVVRVLGQPVRGAANVYVPDVCRAKSELGLRVKVGLAEAIRKSIC